MTKSKSSALARLPKDQRCEFLIGPVNSWFMPNTIDIWTQAPECKTASDNPDESMDCGDKLVESNNNISYFAYGSIGCFCYGEIHRMNQDKNEQFFNQEYRGSVSATVNRLIDIKEDNSRISCVRFLKKHKYPLVMILTETGSFVIHDCSTSENYIQFRKSELITKFLEPLYPPDEKNQDQPSNKRARFSVTRQINSCSWVNPTNAFLAISLLKEKTNVLLHLKLKDISQDIAKNPGAINKTDFIESCVYVNLDLPKYVSPVCCMETAMIDDKTCLVAIAMDDGFITIVKIDLKTNETKRVIKLARHSDQICSLSLFVGNNKKFPMGLLASASRDGLVLVWDIENEYYFADYQAINNPKGAKINWFSVSFMNSKSSKHVHLAVTNQESGITLLELPENIRSKIRLKDNRVKDNKPRGDRNLLFNKTIRHHALIFNIVYDDITNSLISSSLDGNQILWSYQVTPAPNNVKNLKKDTQIAEVRAEYLFPSMSNNSRTHMLRFNTIREDLLAMALGKAGIRFYKISDNPMNHRFDMTDSACIVSRKLAKLNFSPTSVAWNPCHEYQIAVGTIEGKVVCLELGNSRANLIESEHGPLVSPESQGDRQDSNGSAFKTDDLFGVDYQPLQRSSSDKDNEDVPSTNDNQPKTDGIYSMCWGPNPSCPQDPSRSAIYAIGSISKTLFIYYYNAVDNSQNKMMNYLDEFKDKSLPEVYGGCSTVAWKSSMDLMALGTIHGKVIVVSYLEECHQDRSANKLFKKLAVIEGPLGLSHIQCLAWHPAADRDDPCYYYLAASANESAAYVFNLKEALLVADVKSRLKLAQNSISYNNKDGMTASQANSPGDNSVSQYIHILDAHKKAISDIVWNPHEPFQLVTSSFDRCCYVWTLDRSLEEELLSAKILAKFSARDRLFTAEWSVVDPDLVFTSGHDSTVWAWRPSENPFKVNESI